MEASMENGQFKLTNMTTLYQIILFLTTEAKVTPLITQQGLMDPGYMHISFIATLLDFKR